MGLVILNLLVLNLIVQQLMYVEIIAVKIIFIATNFQANVDKLIKFVVIVSVPIAVVINVLQPKANIAVEKTYVLWGVKYAI